MTSDLAVSIPADEPSPKKASKQILKSEIDEGMDALQKGSGSLFMSGLSAGLDLGFSVLLMAVMWSLTHDHFSGGLVRFLVANMYAIGFIFVVVGRSELFTEQTTLAVLPLLRGKTTVAALLRLWLIVYIANLIGAAIFGRLITVIDPAVAGLDPRAFGEIARHVVQFGNADMFMSAVLAGWLMGLLSWLVAAGRDTISQIVIVWLITTSIGFIGLHHVVAGAIELFAGFFAHQGIAAFDIARFLCFATLGNIVGGTVFVAVIKYAHANPSTSDGNSRDDSPDSNGKE